MLNIYCGKTIFDGYDSLMKRLKDNRVAKLFDSHIFVVPDRFSMQCEKDIFEYLDIQSTFDIKVLTLSRFASILLQGENVKSLSKGVCTMIVQKLLIENKSQLKCFNKTKLNYSFASQIYETINQLKSSKVSPEDLAIEGEDFLAIKLGDIKTIYFAYQKYLAQNNLVDSADMFTLFERYLPNAKDLKNTAIYISHFDSFTRQGYGLLEKFIKYAGQVNISVAKETSALNSHIYLNDIYDNVIKIANSLGLEVNVFEKEKLLNKTFEHLKDNLFAYKPRITKLTDKNLTLSCHQSFAKECEFVAVAIKKLLNDGVRQRDICVVIPQLQSKVNVITRVFQDFGFNGFFDVQDTLTHTILTRLIKSLFELSNKYFRQEDIISFIKNPILGLDDNFSYDLENYIIKKSIEGKSLYRDNELLNAFREKAKPYLDFVKKLNDNVSYKQFADELISLFEAVDMQNILQNIALSHYESGRLEIAKKLEQVYVKTYDLIKCMGEVFGETACNSFEVYDVLCSGLESVKIALTPISVDSIFVGDASKSIFSNTKYLFIMGAKEGELPFVASDCGMITDSEIDKLSAFYKLEPTINVINIRERFKLFNMLLLGENLHISYSKGKTNAKPSSFVGYIQKMFVLNDGKTIPMMSDEYNYFDFVQKLGNRTHAEKILSSYLRNIQDGIVYDNGEEIGSLLKVIQESKPYLKEYKNITDYKKQNNIVSNVFFSKGTISVSEIERYYACPYKHFVDYGLKLKENRIDSFDTLEVGNFLHKIAEVFVKENIKNFPIQKGLDKEVERIFDSVIISEDFCEIKQNENNKLSIISIKKESLRMCQAINYQIQKSDFRPILTEARFDNRSQIKSLEISVGDVTLKIVGAIDRIDACKDYFRIIDYKTGRCDSSLKELYYGKKLQLYVYQRVVQKSLCKEPVGAYYFPVKNSFAKEGQSIYEGYKLKGYTLSDMDAIVTSDSDFEVNTDSNILNVIKKKDGGLSSRSEVLDAEGIEALAEYAMQSLALGVKEILDGNVKSSPLVIDGKSSCEYCPYKALCRFDESFGDSSRSASGVVEIDQIKEGSKCKK